MTDPDMVRWDRARRLLIARWRQILARIDARDEGGVLELANEMDEFCDEALQEKQSGPPPTTPGTRCLFCRGFVQHGGCFGVLQDLDKAVMGGRWETARCLAERYVGHLESMDLSAAKGDPAL